MNTRFARSCFLLFVVIGVAVANNAELSDETMIQVPTENYGPVHFFDVVKTYLGLGASQKGSRNNLRSIAKSESSAAGSWLRKLRTSCGGPDTKPPTGPKRPTRPPQAVRPVLPDPEHPVNPNHPKHPSPPSKRNAP